MSGSSDGGLEELAGPRNIEAQSGTGLQRIIIKSPDDAFWKEFFAFVPSDFAYSGMRKTQDVLDLLRYLSSVSFENAKHFFADKVDDERPYVKSSIGLNVALEIHGSPSFIYWIPDEIVRRYNEFNVEIKPAGKMEKVILQISRANIEGMGQL